MRRRFAEDISEVVESWQSVVGSRKLEVVRLRARWKRQAASSLRLSSIDRIAELFSGRERERAPALQKFGRRADIFHR